MKTSAPPEPDLFDVMAAESAELEDGWIGCTFYTVKPVTDITDGDLVLPANWGTPTRVLALTGADGDDQPFEALDDRHIRVYWNCDGGNSPWPPGPYTVFRRDEKVLVAQ